MNQSTAVGSGLFNEAILRAERSFTLAEVKDGAAPLVFVNPAFERTTGYTSEEAIGRDCSFLQGKETDPSTVAAIASAIENGQSITVTVLNYKKDGTPFWNELSLSPVANGTDTPTHYVGVQSDVTERIQTQRHLERLYRSEREAHTDAARAQLRLAAILEQLPSGVVIAEAANNWQLQANPEMERIIGREIGSGVAFEDIFHGYHLDGRRYQEVDWPLNRAQSRGETIIDEEIVIVRGDGSRAIVSVRSTPIRSEAGEIVAAVALFEDITQRKGWEEQLNEERERSAALAWTLQRSLLPPQLPDHVAGLEFGAMYTPVGHGLHVGGDFYDVFERAPGQWVFTIGDVMGKGADAATITALARHSLRTAALHTSSPGELLSLLNGSLLQDGDDVPFCTVAAAVISQNGDQANVTMALGGHPRPYVVRANGAVEAVGVSGTLIGVLDELDVTEETFTLDAGDMLVLYTDGVTEACIGGEMVGEEGLRAILEKVTADKPEATDVAWRIRNEVQGEGSDVVRDDLAVLVAKVVTNAS
jgi:phosphoserine phosphatase RsbU/P